MILIKSQIAQKLQYYRKKSGLSRAQVADHIGCTVSALSYYESGKRQPSADTLVDLIHYFGVTSLSEFFDDAPPSNDISDDENAMLKLFRNALPEGRRACEMILRSYQKGANNK